MALSCFFFLAFQACGIISIRSLLPRRRVLDRIWLGMSLGLLEMIWLPALFAFLFSFGITAHWLGLAAGALTTALLRLIRENPRRLEALQPRGEASPDRLPEFFPQQSCRISGRIQSIRDDFRDVQGIVKINQNYLGNKQVY